MAEEQMKDKIIKNNRDAGNRRYPVRLQHLRRTVQRHLHPLHQGCLRQSPLRKMPAVQRLLQMRDPPHRGLTNNANSWPPAGRLS